MLHNGMIGGKLKTLQLGVDALYGQAHDIVIAAVKTCDTNIAYPLLNAVGAGLVEGAIMLDIMLYLGIAELLEGDVGGD